MCRVAKRSFYRARTMKTFVMGVAEFHHVICAKFGGVFTNFTATLLPTFESFLVLFFKKEQHPYFCNSSTNQNLKCGRTRCAPTVFVGILL